MLRPRDSRLIARALLRLLPRPLWGLLACPLLLALMAGTPGPAWAGKAAKARAAALEKTDMERAQKAYNAMQQYFFTPTTGLYIGEPIGYSYLWPFSQALTATVGLEAIPGLGSRYTAAAATSVKALQAYWDIDNSEEPGGSFSSTLPAYDGTVVPPTGPGGTKFYDDNEWVGLALMQAYQLTHEPADLEHAQQIMAFVEDGWQTSPALTCPGGVPFSNAPNLTAERNLVTDGPGAELAAELNAVTGSEEDLSFAELAYTWARTCLLQSNGLYADRLEPNGAINQADWSYNQGSMIGAGTLLYQATGNSEDLWEARQTAKAALEHFTPGVLAGENPWFVAVYLRNLMYLDSVTRDPPGAKIAQEYVQSMWAHDRKASGLYALDSYSQLLVQAAMVQIYGMLCSPPSTYF